MGGYEYRWIWMEMGMEMEMFGGHFVALLPYLLLTYPVFNIENRHISESINISDSSDETGDSLTVNG